MMSISFPSGPNALRLEACRGRGCTQEDVDLRVGGAVANPLRPGLVGADAGRTNPSMHDTVASKLGKQRRAQGAMVPSHHHHACGEVAMRGWGHRGWMSAYARRYAEPLAGATHTYSPAVARDDPPVEKSPLGQAYTAKVLLPQKSMVCEEHGSLKKRSYPKGALRLQNAVFLGFKCLALSNLRPCPAMSG